MMQRCFSFLFGMLAWSAAFALDAPTESHPGARAFAAELARDPLAIEQGLSEAAILATLDQARYQQTIIDAISRPAESKAWKDYRPIFLTDKRINDGVAFYRAHTELLQRLEKEFGVPASIIVTIIGVETSYGRITGKYRVLDALTTLAFYYPARAPFFQGELKQLFLLHGTRFPYATTELMGSYAGAMGWGQFMPSSIAKFARDEDSDGKIDLWNSISDICASVANYFTAHGWQTGGPVAVRANVDKNARAITPSTLEPVYPLAQLEEWGYHLGSNPDGAKLDSQTPVTLLQLEGAQGTEFWIVFQNFYVISRYNRSPLYSMAVLQLSEAITQALSKPAQ